MERKIITHIELIEVGIYNGIENVEQINNAACNDREGEIFPVIIFKLNHFIVGKSIEVYDGF